MFTSRISLKILIAFLIVEQIVAPPAAIKKNQNAEHEKHAAIETNEVEDMLADEEFNVEYQRYLKEVISTLETDDAFKKKVEEASKTDFDSGQIANELAMVNHNVRSKLDELKRKEVERLRQLVRELDSRGKGNSLHPSQYEHIDHHNLDTFEIKDLNNLIKKVSKDIDEINQMRRKQFKEYEMEKHFEDEMKMKNMTEAEKKEYQQQLEDMKKKHANHEKVHHPGSKAQFEEVWEKQDQLESQEFDPKTFFYLHDMDGNGYWDMHEVNALFVKELDKLYQSGLPEDDMRERHEEMERMREHVFSEMDKNHDNMISLDEYMEETKTKEFNQDEGWDTLENQQIYSQQEYEEFEKRRMQQIQEMMDRGYHHPGAGYYPQGPGPNGMPVQYHPESQYGYQVHPNQQGYHPNQQGYYPNQMNPQGYHPNQVHPGQVNMNQHPNQMNQHPNQMNQHPNQMNQHPNQMNQHPNQINQYPNQANQYPNQMNQHPNQVNQHPNQVNQHPNQVNQHQQANNAQSNEVHQNSNQQQHVSNDVNNQAPNHANLPAQPPSPSNSGGANPQTNQVNNQAYQQQQAYQQPPNQVNQQGYQQPPHQANQAGYQQPPNQAYQQPPNQQAYQQQGYQQQQNVQQPSHQQQGNANKNQQYNQQAHH